ncbi:MAG: hypothetical protein GYA46_12365, partial [candidate division Zixibacteria bacterium]|nr:hypothetical protein [candidate division Zixibacteria bacterium]
MKYRLVVWMIVLALVPIRAGAQDETATVTLKTDPAKTHQLMWQQLQPRLAARQAGDKSIAAVTATNWQEYDMFFYRLDLTIDYSTEMVYGRVGTHGRPTV